MLGQFGKFYAAVAMLLVLGVQASIAQTPKSAVVGVNITVTPFAAVTFPSGPGFTLTVPPACPPLPAYLPRHLRHLWLVICHDHVPLQNLPLIRPARIPFSVTGNAAITVSGVPSEFLTIPGGRFLGSARRADGATLGYHAIMHFPVASPHYHWVSDWPEWDDWRFWRNWTGYGHLPSWSQIAHLPGLDDTGTTPLSADLPALGQQAFGVIYAVARRTWTTSGARATPGDYLGSIVITVSVE